ncbi:hypothetical protein TIFTF001_037315 [Ficus carica]|uniref:Retrotransposon gag domain-containing protein n=1 Tax=Ficus carica TaxID=3494 RepID=A0AA88E5X9_FICCA|nr:hypothetical protein TIFTF001_037315 [Ficus carica]
MVVYVSSLLAILDARRWDMVGLTVKSVCQHHSHYPRLMDEDRDAALVFYGMQPVLFDGTRKTVSLAGCLYDMELIFREPAIPGGSWADFHVLIIACYGPLLDKEANMPYRDPEIYNDIFQDAMLPYIPRDLGVTLESMIDAIMEAKIIAHMLQAAAPKDDYLLVPFDDAGVGEPLFQGGPILPEDPIPAVPLQKTPPQEAEEVRQGVPRNFKVPLAPAGIQANPPLVREDLLYEPFKRMKAPEFEGPTDPIEVDNWLIDIQDARHWWITVQMRRDVATMSWQDFVAEFRTMYYNIENLAAQQDEFNSLKQGSMTVLEAVKKFEQLARLCSELVPNEIEKDKEVMAQIFKAKKEEKVVFGKNKKKGNVTGQGQLRNYPQKKGNRGNEGNNNNYPVCAQCGKKHLGVCRLGTNACYLYGKEGQYARNCTLNSQNQNPQ